MIPLIENAVVKKRQWLTAEQFLDIVVISQMAPGVIAVNVAVTVGYQIAGFPGAIVATFGAALPSFLIIVAVAYLFMGLQGNPFVEAFFKGARPAVMVLLISAAYTMGKKAVHDKTGVFIIALGAAGMIFLDIHPILAIIGAGVFGAFYYKKGKVHEGR